MAEIAGMFISPFLQVCFERMASREFVDFFRERELNYRLLRRLKMTLRSVNAVVEDAEDKQFTKPYVKEWLDDLKEAVYDVEDILDEIATEELRQKLEAEFGTPSEDILDKFATIASKVRIPISTSSFVEDIESKIEELLERLEFLVKEKENLGLRADVGGQPLERQATTSLVDESSIFGRDDDKNEIINSLLSDGASGDDMGVIAIVGMGGMGKTTLAQLVYNDDRLKEHFNRKAWVCVSNDFDVLKLTKIILEEVGSPTDSDNLNQLQIKLKEMLTEKKFLLVLDDVWNKDYDKWELLCKPFKSNGPQGSRVLVTTRDQDVASVMFANKTRRINELPKEDCLLLFEKYAFQNLNLDARQEGKELGREILEKCQGLPLAIKAIGSLLGSKSNVKEWGDVLRSELWHLPIEKTGILPALSLSYKHLSPHLRRCFAYCSIFPKDYAFKKDTLVLLWMAEGFLPQLPNKTMEEVGDDCFLALVSRSLFQRSNHDEYIMHDLVNDLAKFISKQFTLSHEDGCSREIGSNTRHFSFYFQKFDNDNLKAFHRAERLRTIVELNFYRCGMLASKGNQFSLPMIRCLRVLILSHYEDITELPDSIEKLIHLRYLDISNTMIKRLPDSICKLCNLQILNLSHCDVLAALPKDMHKLISLQILNLFYCRSLAALPRDMHKLTHLRHLNIAETGIMEMPINLGELKCLQTLSTFIVSKHNECDIEELGKLTNLRESLSVLELQNVESLTNAKGANLKDKKYLEKLVLKWKVDTTASESRNIILDSLKPHSILKSLSIYGYGGTSFPKWVGDASFSNIASLRLENCKFCHSLPPLGQLPSLQYLWIVGLDGVITIGSEFYGIGSSIKPFGALKYLRFSNMLEWKEWFPFEAENEGGAFPNLRELWIFECPKLTGGLPAHLPCLAELFIYECPQLEASLPRASSQRKLTLSNCNTILLNESPTGIHEFRIKSCSKLKLPMHLNYSSLLYLTLDGCGFLKSFPLFRKLRHLIILDCEDIESLTVGELHEHELLLSLIQIHRCPNFAYFPQEGLHAPNLKDFWIGDCRILRSLPDKMHILFPSLEKLYIKDCPEVESFPEGGLPSNLNEIYIFNCDKLFASRMGWGLQNLLCVRRFSISNKSEDVESFPDEGFLPTCLTYLCIKGFPNLKSLDKKGLQHLTALEELMISDGLKLECMPEDGLPASLSTLNIIDCPLLKKEWERKEGEEWGKIAHVPNKYIDRYTRIE